MKSSSGNKSFMKLRFKQGIAEAELPTAHSQPEVGSENKGSIISLYNALESFGVLSECMRR